MTLSALAFSAMGVFVEWLGSRLPTQEIVLVRACVSIVLLLALLRGAGVSPWATGAGCSCCALVGAQKRCSLSRA
jgi:hypothetical protein